MSSLLISRRQALIAAAAAAGGAFGLADLAHSATTDSAAGGPLRVGYLPITDAAPLLLAHSGLYPAGVGKPVLFRSWAALGEAFLNRQLDVVHLLMPMAVQLRYALGGGVRVLGWNHTNGSALTVAPHIRELSDLAGSQLAIPFWWSIHNIVLQKLLRANGLQPVIRRSASRADRTVELVVMSPSDMVPALATGTIGGYVVADPFNAMAQTKKIGRIHTFLGDVWRDHACCALVTRDDVISGRPAAVQQLTDAVVTAQVALSNDRKAAAAKLGGGRYLPQPVPAITLAMTYPTAPYPLRHPEWQPQRLGFQPYPFPSFTRELVTAMHDTVIDGDRRFLERLDPTTVHGDLVDDTFVRNSIQAHGGPVAFGLSGDYTRTEQLELS
ncbi:ABC transporter substrate-binding protein [Mycolicibacterium sp. lyk4-40-TYG-92]|uniref:ABC transporter substrate-binding protein n=1 Tax=Mycolicibacterium sp. lyk4-40-TYG-92 TaxID=3040295 RepID=UPI002551C656|nr:ABC transporter substrate-binding protein [Mycolicibacterium sp. lyk4-40-TYG-92]